MGLPLFITPGAPDTSDEVSDLISEAIALVADARIDSGQARTEPGIDLLGRLTAAQSRLERAMRERRRELRGRREGNEEVTTTMTARARAATLEPGASLVDEEVDGDELGSDNNNNSEALLLRTAAGETMERSREMWQTGLRVRERMERAIIELEAAGNESGPETVESQERQLEAPRRILGLNPNVISEEGQPDASPTDRSGARQISGGVSSPAEERLAETMPGSWAEESDAEDRELTSRSTPGNAQVPSRGRAIIWSSVAEGSEIRRINQDTWSPPRRATPAPIMHELTPLSRVSRALQRENASISLAGATAGDIIIEDNDTESGVEHPYFNSATREDLLTQMMDDIEIYDRARERNFGRDNGYRRHSPTRATRSTRSASASASASLANMDS